MIDTESIRTNVKRTVQAMTKQPSIAKGVIRATATYNEGLACEVACGPWKVIADMPQKAGGTETAPSPGEYMITALGSCQVITTIIWAARFEVPIEKLKIEVEVEKDSRGLYGVDNQPSHWRSIKYRVDIQSPAPEAAVQKVLDAAHTHSPMSDNLEHSFVIAREVNITTPVS